jgi:2-polyprenyl-3-methyl-5-hydroxy-6-metoxy-1,4-benzoquinol methylase
VSGAPYRLKDDPYSSHSLILSRLGDGRGRRVLDVGAADGFLAERLAGMGWKVTALERDPAQAARAAARCEQALTVDLERERPPLARQYDAVIYGDVVEHLSDPLRVMQDLNQHLAPNAVIIVSVPNVAHLLVRLSLLVGRFQYADRGILDRTHLSFFTRRTFLEFLAAASLTVRELRVTPVPLPVVVPPRFHGAVLGALHRLSAGAARLWPGGLAYQFVAVCAETAAAGGDR